MLPFLGTEMRCEGIKNRRVPFKTHEAIVSLEEWRWDSPTVGNCSGFGATSSGLGWEGCWLSLKLYKKLSSWRFGGSGGVLPGIYWEAKWLGFCCPEQGEGYWGMSLIKSYERELPFLRLAEWGWTFFEWDFKRGPWKSGELGDTQAIFSLTLFWNN